MCMPKYFSFVLYAAVFFCIVLQQTAAAGSLKLVVNIPSRVLQLYDGGEIKKEYPVGLGTRENQTPIGKFKIVGKELNPVWIQPVKGNETPLRIESGPENPLGYRWMEFSGLYGIHGTNNPGSIGGFVSNGCIRMLEGDVEELYDIVPIHTPLEITYERIFIKEDAADGIQLHIYPDEYNMKNIAPQEVQNEVAAYGLQDFVSLARLQQALQKRSGTVFSLGKAFSLMVFGKKLPEKAVQQGAELYIPVLPVATEAMVDVAWDRDRKLLCSLYGCVEGFDKNNVLYVKEKDLYALLRIYSSRYLDGQALYLDYNKY